MIAAIYQPEHAELYRHRHSTDDPGDFICRREFVGDMQQLSLSGGVAVAAMLLDVSRTFEGRTVWVPDDFGRAFIAVRLIALVSTLFMLRLAPDAGAEVSGHRHGPEHEPAEPGQG